MRRKSHASLPLSRLSTTLLGHSTMLPGAFALTLACLALASMVASFSVPSPSSIGSDVTLLYHNDIDGELFSPLSYSVLMPRL